MFSGGAAQGVRIAGGADQDRVPFVVQKPGQGHAVAAVVAPAHENKNPAFRGKGAVFLKRGPGRLGGVFHEQKRRNAEQGQRAFVPAAHFFGRGQGGI